MARRISRATQVMREAANREGLEYAGGPDTEFAKAWHIIPETRRSGTFAHLMYGLCGETEVTVFQHVQSNSGLIGAGIYAPDSAYSIYSTPADGCPDTHVTRFIRGPIAALLLRKSRRNRMLTGDPAFDKRRVVQTTDVAFATKLLTTELREFILSKPSVQWRIAGQRLCLIYPGPIRPDRIHASIQRLLRFVVLCHGFAQRSEAKP